MKNLMLKSLMLKHLAKEPFVHFLVLGLIVTLVFSLRQPGGAQDLDVVVTPGDIARLEALWQGQYSRPPTQQELSGLIDSHIREEVLFREAMALNLADDDIIVRRRLVQKFVFLSEDLIDIPQPGEEELMAWYEANKNLYLRSQQTSFSHVYLSEQKRGERAKVDATIMVASLQKSDDAWRAAGDPFMLQREYAARKQSEIAQLFGVGFAGDLNDMNVGVWSGPLRSAYGWHAVKVLSRGAEAHMPFAQIRDDVLADYRGEKKAAASKALYDAVRARYTVSIERESP